MDAKKYVGATLVVALVLYEKSQIPKENKCHR